MPADRIVRKSSNAAAQASALAVAAALNLYAEAPDGQETGRAGEADTAGRVHREELAR